MKKGELSINVIVMAVVALLVLVVLAILLVRYMQGGDEQLSQCRDKGGDCYDDCQGVGSHYVIGDGECTSHKDGRDSCCISGDSLLSS